MPKKLPVFIQRALSDKRIPNGVIDKITNEIRPPPEGFTFMTQTLRPCMNKMCAHNQFMVTIHDMRSMLDYYASDYCLVTEITKQGNVHYHYWIVPKEEKSIVDIIDATKRNKRFGFTLASNMVKVQTHDENAANVFRYMLKGVSDTYRYVRNMHMVLNWSNMDYSISVSHVTDTSCLDYNDIDWTTHNQQFGIDENGELQE